MSELAALQEDFENLQEDYMMMRIRAEETEKDLVAKGMQIEEMTNDAFHADLQVMVLRTVCEITSTFMVSLGGNLHVLARERDFQGRKELTRAIKEENRNIIEQVRESVGAIGDPLDVDFADFDADVDDLSGDEDLSSPTPGGGGGGGGGASGGASGGGGEQAGGERLSPGMVALSADDARELAERRSLEMRRNSSAVMIQSHWRGKKARLEFQYKTGAKQRQKMASADFAAKKTLHHRGQSFRGDARDAPAPKRTASGTKAKPRSTRVVQGGGPGGGGGGGAGGQQSAGEPPAIKHSNDALGTMSAGELRKLVGRLKTALAKEQKRAAGLTRRLSQRAQYSAALATPRSGGDGSPSGGMSHSQSGIMRPGLQSGSTAHGPPGGPVSAWGAPGGAGGKRGHGGPGHGHGHGHGHGRKEERPMTPNTRKKVQKKELMNAYLGGGARGKGGWHSHHGKKKKKRDGRHSDPSRPANRGGSKRKQGPGRGRGGGAGGGRRGAGDKRRGRSNDARGRKGDRDRGGRDRGGGRGAGGGGRGGEKDGRGGPGRERKAVDSLGRSAREGSIHEIPDGVRRKYSQNDLAQLDATLESLQNEKRRIMNEISGGAEAADELERSIKDTIGDPNSALGRASRGNRVGSAYSAEIMEGMKRNMSKQQAQKGMKKQRASFYKIGTMARRLSRQVLLQRHSVALGADAENTSKGAREAAGYAAAALTSLFRQSSQKNLLKHQPAQKLGRVESMHAMEDEAAANDSDK